MLPTPHLSPEVLNAYLDAALPAPEHAAAEAHLARCPACAQELAALQAVFARLQAWPAQPAPRNFAASVVQQLQAQAQPAFVLPRLWRVALALQALIAFGVFGFFAAGFLPLTSLPTLPAWPTPWPFDLQPLAQQLTSFGQGFAPSASEITWGVSLTLLGAAWLLGSGWLLRPLQQRAPRLHNHL